MNPSEVLRIVDVIHRDKRIDKEIVFVGVEAAIATAARKQYGEDSSVIIHVDRETGEITGFRNGEPLDPKEFGERIGAQSAKQVMIQKIKEAERDAVYEENRQRIDQLVSGIVQRNESGVTTINLPGVEAVLPRSERLPGEMFRTNDRLRAVIIDVKKVGNRVRVVLSRIRPLFVQRLFEQEVPEIQDAVIEVKGVSREPGYRTKIAVYSADTRIDSVGACIGMRGSRIKNITEELNSERIDVIAWNPDMQIFIPNALRPAEVDEVILCSMLGRAIVLVRQDQRSLAIGKKGQNVRLASKLCCWDVEIMTREELEADIEKAVEGYALIEGVTSELADRLVGEGFLSFADLSIIEPNDLAQMGDISIEAAEAIIEQADRFADREEEYKEEQKGRKTEQIVDDSEAEEIDSYDSTQGDDNQVG
ncbi:MAG: transcription termination factor NusA [Thermoguttaceae bacterium]